MFGVMLFLGALLIGVLIFGGGYVIKVAIHSSRASAAEIKRSEVDSNHRECVRLLDAMLVQDSMAPYLTEAHRDRATELVDEYHSD